MRRPPRGPGRNRTRRKKPRVFAPRPRRFPQRVARAPQKSQKTSSFCTSTTPIPAEGRAGTLEIAKTHGFLHLDHADPRRGSRGNFRNRKKPWVFAPRPRRSPQRVDFRVVSSALPRRPKRRFLTPRKSIALDSLHLQLALGSLLVSRSHCKESLQGVIARSHCKESWQGVMQGVIARSHCKESLQGVIARSHESHCKLQGVKCMESSASRKCTELSASCKCKEPSARSQVQGAKCMESSASCKCMESSASCKCKESSASCKQGVKCKLQSLP